jgi:hypothetical protein
MQFLEGIRSLGRIPREMEQVVGVANIMLGPFFVECSEMLC